MVRIGGFGCVGVGLVGVVWGLVGFAVSGVFLSVCSRCISFQGVGCRLGVSWAFVVDACFGVVVAVTFGLLLCGRCVWVGVGLFYFGLGRSSLWGRVGAVCGGSLGR